MSINAYPLPKPLRGFDLPSRGRFKREYAASLWHFSASTGARERTSIIGICCEFGGLNLPLAGRSKPASGAKTVSGGGGGEAQTPSQNRTELGCCRVVGRFNAESAAR
jgi:hypothetical protein